MPLVAIRFWRLLLASGASLTAEGDTLRARKPGGLTPAERERIAACKPALLALARLAAADRARCLPATPEGDLWALGRLAQAGVPDALGAWHAALAIYELEQADRIGAAAGEEAA